MSDKILQIRKIEGANILETVNCAYIAKRFFNRSRAWIIQRLNNNIVNGKPISFNPEELEKFRESLKTLANEITQFADNLPQSPPDK